MTKKLSLIISAVILIICSVSGFAVWAADENLQTVSYTAPDKVSGVTLSDITTNSMTVNWNKQSGVSGYQIFKYDGYKDYVEVKRVSADVESYTQTELQPCTAYFFKVKAYTQDSDGKIYYSEISDFATGSTVPLSVKATSAIKDSDTLTVSWNQVKTSGYQVYYSTDSTFQTDVNMAKAPEGAGSCVIKSIDKNSTYYVRVKAYRNWKNYDYVGDYANTITSTDVPGKPSGVRISSSSTNSVTLTWDKQSGVSGYQIFKYDGYKDYVEVKRVSADMTSYTQTGLQPCIAYYFKVKAYVQGGDGKKYYSEASNYATGATVPLSVKATSAVRDSNTLTVKWNQVNTSGYQVYYSTDSSFNTDINMVKAPEGAGSCVIKDIDKNSVYYVRVKAYRNWKNNDYVGDYANTLASVSIPDKPSGVKISSSSTDSVTLTWNKQSGVSGYQIFKYDGYKDYVEVKRVSADMTSYTQTGLQPCIAYYFKVKAYVQGSDGKIYYSEASDYATGATVPLSVKVVAAAKDGSDMAVEWYPVNCSGYQIFYSTDSSFNTNVKYVYSPQGSTFCKIGSLSANSKYYVKVRAYREHKGNYYMGNFANYLGSKNIPDKVTGLKITNTTPDAVTLSWNRQSLADGYQILRYDSYKDQYVEVKRVSADNTSCTIYGHRSSTAYYYKVRGYNVQRTDGKGYYYGWHSDYVTAATTPLPVTVTSVSKSGSNLYINWDAVTCTGYYLSYSTDSSFRTNTTNLYLGENVTSYTAKNINSYANYYVRIRAYRNWKSNNYYGSFGNTLGTYFSNLYATYSSNYVDNYNRTVNLKIASEAISGTIIYPGEVFSFNNVVGPRTAAKGYRDALLFTSTGTESGLGGGICQVASTMFNCALYANVGIVERHQHSQRVSYVPLGIDAAIYGTAQDFKWRNTTGYPIKIIMTVENGVITCSFYTSEYTKPYPVSLEVSRSGNVFTMRRVVNGYNINYTCKSKY